MRNVLGNVIPSKKSNNIGDFTSITKKEEMNVLVQDINKKLQVDTIDYKKGNITSGKKGGKKPEFMWYGVACQGDKAEPGRIEIDKNNVIKITIQTGDILQVNNQQYFTDKDKAQQLANLGEKKASERTEIQVKDKLNIGQEYTCKFKFMIPKDFPLSANRLVIAQWKQETDVKGASQNPFLAQKLKRGKIQFYINTSGDIEGKRGATIIGEIPVKNILGNRIDMEYTFKFSSKDDGYLKINMKGENDGEYKKVVNYHGPLASNTNHPEIRKDTVYFKFGLYRDNYDYGIKLLKKYNKEEKNDNLEQDIAAIEKAKKEEKNGNPMTIYFKDYSVENID